MYISYVYSLSAFKILIAFWGVGGGGTQNPDFSDVVFSFVVTNVNHL